MIALGERGSLARVGCADLHRSVQIAVDARQGSALGRLRPVPKLVPQGEKVLSDDWDIIHRHHTASLHAMSAGTAMARRCQPLRNPPARKRRPGEDGKCGWAECASVRLL